MTMCGRRPSVGTPADSIFAKRSISPSIALSSMAMAPV
jgi:hypothetical protein